MNNQDKINLKISPPKQVVFYWRIFLKIDAKHYEKLIIASVKYTNLAEFVYSVHINNFLNWQYFIYQLRKPVA